MQSLAATKSALSSVNQIPFRVKQYPASDTVGQIDLIGTEIAFAKDNQFYGESEPATYLYKVITGLVRTYRMTAEGRRQIIAFYVPGDLFGFETGNTYTLSAEAITEARVRAIKRSLVMNRATHDFDVANQLWLGASNEIRRNQQHILQFGRSAEARVADFLLEMARRMPIDGTVALSISRQDIADYLDLRIETVSRAMTRLVRQGRITLSSSRKVVIRNSKALAQLKN